MHFASSITACDDVICNGPSCGQDFPRNDLKWAEWAAGRWIVVRECKKDQQDDEACARGAGAQGFESTEGFNDSS
jgi:hypothetical protein